jgi:hypothetical protein
MKSRQQRDKQNRSKKKKSAGKPTRAGSNRGRRRIEILKDDVNEKEITKNGKTSPKTGKASFCKGRNKCTSQTTTFNHSFSSAVHDVEYVRSFTPTLSEKQGIRNLHKRFIKYWERRQNRIRESL